MLKSPFRCKVRQTAGYPFYPSGKMHSGVDYVPVDKTVETNWFIYTPISGTITCGRNNVYGNYVVIVNEYEKILFAHLDSVEVTRGFVNIGQMVGVAGNTGNSTGRHLHTEYRLWNKNRKDWDLVNPDLYINFNEELVPMWKNGSTIERLYFCAEHAYYNFDDCAHLVIPPRKQGELIQVVPTEGGNVYAVKVPLGCGTCVGFVKYKGGA